jgi:hypothetical protein
MQKLLYTTLLLFVFAAAFCQLESPDEVLPHKLGEQFTPHYMLVDYFEKIAAESDKVKLVPYGKTNQDRPLFVAIVSAPSNLKNLEEIRLNNLRLTGLEPGEPDLEKALPIVWLSFSVHGNEPSGSECSMQLLYDLISGEGDAAKWLENTIIIIDPAVNPDGYSRYTHWFRNVAHQTPNPNLQSREHQEPWPRGRVNHYYFDLNRDWAWATQVETQQRLKLYQEWLPHVHPDVHEQYIDNPYYFAPAAEPYHPYISQWQRDFQTEIGKNHARYFDENGWLYFTREIFDLFYPSYGDTYPTFNGAIGMTYEQAGHSTAGRAATMKNGDTLLLKDRIAHHLTTCKSTIEMASQNAEAVVNNFHNYFKTSTEKPTGKYKTFIIKSKEGDQHRLSSFLELLELHKVRYYMAAANISGVKAFSYQDNKNVTVDVAPSDVIISAYQPKSILAQVLLEPEAELSDSLTYDITAWALPYAYNLEAYACTQSVSPTDNESKNRSSQVGGSDAMQGDASNAYAWLIAWNDVADAQFLAALLKKGIKVRYARTDFSLDGKAFEKGTLVVTKADNSSQSDWSKIIQDLAWQNKQRVYPVNTGFVDNGKDLGSYLMELMVTPEVALVYDETVDNHSYGFIWHYFEKDLAYPLHAISLSQLTSGRLDRYNVIILPEGYLQLDDDALDKLSTWVAAGNKLMVVGNTHKVFEGKEGWGLNSHEVPHDKMTRERDSELTVYGNTERSNISLTTPGAIVKTKLDTSHPLAYGLGDFYFSLKTNDFHQPYLDKGWNVGYLEENIEKKGFIGADLLKKMPNTMVFGVYDKGQGSVNYLLDDPLFRNFWYQGKLLFSNAIFF